VVVPQCQRGHTAAVSRPRHDNLLVMVVTSDYERCDFVEGYIAVMDRMMKFGRLAWKSRSRKEVGVTVPCDENEDAEPMADQRSRGIPASSFRIGIRAVQLHQHHLQSAHAAGIA
jgi:hypothetical protein